MRSRSRDSAAVVECGVGLVHFAVRLRGNLRGEGNDVADITRTEEGRRKEGREKREDILLCIRVQHEYFIVCTRARIMLSAVRSP